MKTLYSIKDNGFVITYTIEVEGVRVKTKAGVMGKQATCEVISHSSEDLAKVKAKLLLKRKLKEGYILINDDEMAEIPRTELRQFILDNRLITCMNI